VLSGTTHGLSAGLSKWVAKTQFFIFFTKKIKNLKFPNFSFYFFLEKPKKIKILDSQSQQKTVPI